MCVGVCVSGGCPGVCVSRGVCVQGVCPWEVSRGVSAPVHAGIHPPVKT